MPPQMTKLYKFHLTLIQLSKKKKKPLFKVTFGLGGNVENFNSKSDIWGVFSPRKLCANKNKVWQEHFINHLYPRTGHCQCHICWWDVCKRPAAETQSVTWFCWRFHLWRFSFPVTKFSQEDIASFWKPVKCWQVLPCLPWKLVLG